MAQFDVHRNASRRPGAPPYLLVVQSGRFDEVPRRLAVPLVPHEVIGPVDPRLSPELIVEGRGVVLATLELASLPMAAFGARVDNVAGSADDLIRAIGLVLSRAWG